MTSDSNKKTLPTGTVASMLVQKYINENATTEKSSEWDDLADFERTVATGILDIHDSIIKNVSMLEAINYNSPELSNAVRTYESDFMNIASDLEFIGKQHEGRTGAATSNDDYAKSIELFEKYRQLDVTMRASFLPVCATITDSLLIARNDLVKKGLTPENFDEKFNEIIKQEECDVNVVTDVVAK